MIITEERLKELLREELNEILGLREKAIQPSQDSKQAQKQLKRARIFLQKAYRDLKAVSEANFKPEEVGFWMIFSDQTSADELARDFAKKIFNES